jgi:NADH-quinone oxidoreductase subunit L
MENSVFINVFLLSTVLGFVLSLMMPAKEERALSAIAFTTAGFNLFGFLIFWFFWAWQGFPTLNIKEVELYQAPGYSFLIDFFFDRITATYYLVGSLLTFLITVYSRYYLHREQGYKRFFNTIQLFYMGYVITIFSGNFETLFLGWEILGISSFMLIAFYRDRYLPVKNAVKVFSIYRIGDVGILLAMWASHHLWHENITFIKLNNFDLVHEHLESHSGTGIFISLMILVAAAAKSAQLPFSSWLPRAMEGPTPSSAIFYGSLSVHFGVFLLLRTFPFWEHQLSVRILIAAVGLSTSIVTVLIARTQSSVKSQIAYASVSQIGLIFIEVAAGLHTLALIHFAGNAFLRSYQLLVSPSVVSYLIRDQFYHFQPKHDSLEDKLPRKWENTIYLLSLKEWKLDKLLSKWLFTPMKRIGHQLDFINKRNMYWFFVPFLVITLFTLEHQQALPQSVHDFLVLLYGAIALLFVLKSFSERKSPTLAWMLILFYHTLMAVAISFNEHFDPMDTLLYLSGVIPAGLIGFVCLKWLQSKEPDWFTLQRYHGHSYEYPRLSFLFFLTVLGLMGFPITASFIGEDLVFSHIHEDQYLLAFFNASCFIISGISLVRIYARLFLGPHVKTYHELPYQSS